MPKSNKKDRLENSKRNQPKPKPVIEKTARVKPSMLKIFFPAIVVGGLILIYGLFNVFFIQCPRGLCSPVNGALISGVDETRALDLSKAEKDINCKLDTLKAAEATLSNRRSSQKTMEDHLAISAKQIDDENIKIYKLTGVMPAEPEESEILGEVDSKEIKVQPKPEDSSDPKIKELNNKIKELTQTQLEQQAELKRREIETSKALVSKDTAENQVIAARTSISSRYVSRVLWIFFSGLYLVFFIAAIFFTIYVMQKALDDLPKNPFWKHPLFWHLLTLLAAVGLFIAVWRGEESVMSIVGAMYKVSMFDTNEIPKLMVTIFNAIAFAVIVYLVAASCSMLYAVAKERDLDLWRDNSRILLFLNGALLFVGLLRIDIISKWHLVFVSGAYQPLLESYFTNSLTIQALFYTIIVAVIYLPLSYSFKSTEADPSVKKSMTDNGFWATVTTFAPRLFLIVSPLLAKPVADLFKFLLNVQTD